MKDSYTKTAALALTAVLVGSATCIDVPAAPADSLSNTADTMAPVVRPPKPATFHPPEHAAPEIPQPEPGDATSPNAGFGSNSVFSAATSNTVTPNAQTLGGPVTLTYGGSSPAFSLTDSGTNRGLTASITNTHDAGSALYGATVGSGAGLTGINSGLAGPGGKFQVSNADSAQPGAFATTNGAGSAVLGTITNTYSGYPAVYGQSLGSSNGHGVEGDGNAVGVYGYVPSSTTKTYGSVAVYGENDSTTLPAAYNWGVYGAALGNGIGVRAEAQSGIGLSASSQSNYAVYAFSSGGSGAIYGETDALFGRGVSGIVTANDGRGVYGQSTNGSAVYGYETSGGAAIVGYAPNGTAGAFFGDVSITNQLTVGNIVYTSDRNLKSDIRPIDGKDVLARVSQLPISSWHYTSDPQKRHIGPTAQDFHAAFGLSGADDRHISVVDIAGVSLAAIQELNSQMQSQMKIKDAQIAELKAQAMAQTQAMAQMQQIFAARMTALERRRVDSTRSVALERSAKQRVAMD